MSDAKRIRVGMPFAATAGAGAFDNFSLNGSTDQAEWTFNAPEAATLTRLGIRLASITGTTPTYRISLQGITTAGVPDGTIKGGGSPASATFSPSGLGWAAGEWHWITLDNSYACTRGEMLSVVVDYSSGTINGSNFAAITMVQANATNSHFPLAIYNDAGSRSRSATAPAVFGYGSAGTAYGFPMETINTTNYTLNSTPDEHGLKFTLPAGWGDTFQVVGVRAFGDQQTGSTLRIQLYDSDGTTVLQSITYDTDLSPSWSGRFFEIYFDEATLSTLNFGTAYRIGMRPDDTNTHVFHNFNVDAAADWDAWAGGQQFAHTSRTNDGAWTDTTTRRPLIELILADWTEPSGGGGGVILSGMNGGLRG